MRRIVPLALLLASVACGDSDSAAIASTVRDSAGVIIVESSGPAWTASTALALSAEPAVSIGDMDGPPEHQLYKVRAALRLSDGTIVVFDGSSQELRFYDSTGVFVRRVGGKGGGPGEYQRVTWLRRFAVDSIMVHDPDAQRITVLAPMEAQRGRSILPPSRRPARRLPAPSGERRWATWYGTRWSARWLMDRSSLPAMARP